MEAPRIWIALRAVIKCEKRDILVTSSRTKSRDLSCTPVWRRRYDSGKWEYFHERSQKERGQEGFLDCARNDETEGGLFHLKFESRNRSSSIPFLWKGNARRARGWPRERKATSQPPPLRGTSFQRKEGKQRSGIAPFILYGASVFLCAALPP